MNNAHEFALYYELLSSELKAQKKAFFITDSECIRRITSVLRLKPGEQVILFDRSHHARVIIKEIAKKQIAVELPQSTDQAAGILSNTIYQPSLTLLLPLLKREAFDEALYAAVELGVTSIQLVITHKSRPQLTSAELERAQRLMIAASEQSKNFASSQLHAPKPLSEVLVLFSQDKYSLIYFDAAGAPLLLMLQTVQKDIIEAHKEMVCMAGPEGDLTDEEKKLLENRGFSFCALTPTVLRSIQAINVGIGAFRSLRK